MFTMILRKIGLIKSKKISENSNIWIIICQNPEFQVVAMNHLDLTAVSKFGVLSGFKNLQNL